MGNSAKFQAELLVRDLEIQAEKLLEQASILRGAGQSDIANQIVVQRERLLGAIAEFRSVKNFESLACP